MDVTGLCVLERVCNAEFPVGRVSFARRFSYRKLLELCFGFNECGSS
jgi:hypothetical protein